LVRIWSGVWVARHIVQGDSWESGHDSPLNAPGINIKPGDKILAIAGTPLSPTCCPAELLMHQADTDVALTTEAADGSNRRTVVVRTLRSELKARYREWVERNLQWVHEQSGGAVGYVHVPDMGPRGYAEFHRYYLREVAHSALIIDVRYNSGGHVSQLLLEKLARRRIAYNVRRHGKPMSFPLHSPAGPLVALADENAGSDGDIFAHAFKLRKLGTLVGKRTWGGVIGMSPKDALVDRTLTTQPEYSNWFIDVGWDLENHGTTPDIDVDIKPQDWAAGRDPQLMEALRVAMKELEGRPPFTPDFSVRPNLAAPKLPTRDNLGDPPC